MEAKNINQQPSNKRSRTTGKLELRKLWNVPKAEYFWALFVEVETQTAVINDATKEPDWEKITETEKSWQTPQGYLGDEDWAKRTAEHFNIPLPTEEYKLEEDKSDKE